MFKHIDRHAVAASALVVAATVLALAVRLWTIGEKSIWLDEAWSWRAAKLSVPDMVEWTATDKHPPLYYAVLHYWVALFGDGETMLRTPSAIFGALTVALVVLACVAWRQYALGAVAGLLLALHPMHVTYSQEARMYPLLGLLAVASSLAAAMLVRRPTVARAALYAALAGAMTYTQYSAFFVVAVQAGLFAAYALRVDDARTRLRLIVPAGTALALVAVAFLPWAPNVARDLDGVDHLPQLNGDTIEAIFARLFGLDQLDALWIAAAVPIVVFGAYGLWKRVGEPEIVFVAALLIVPVAEAVFSIAVTPVLAYRQASSFAPGFALLAAVAVVELGAFVRESAPRLRADRLTAGVAAAGLAAIMLVGCARWYEAASREDWRAAAEQFKSGDGAIFVWRGYSQVPLNYYLRSPRVSGFEPAASANGAVPADAVVFSHHTPSEMDRVIAELRAAYTVTGPRLFGSQIVTFTLSPKAP